MADRVGLDAAVEALTNDHISIDVLVNNAGMQHQALLGSFPADKFDQLLQTNIASLFCVSKAIAPQMISCGSGKKSTLPECRQR